MDTWLLFEGEGVSMASRMHREQALLAILVAGSACSHSEPQNHGDEVDGGLDGASAQDADADVGNDDGGCDAEADGCDVSCQGSQCESLCNPGKCAVEEVCEPTRGACCECKVGENICEDGAQRTCTLAADGCGTWGPALACTTGLCSSSKKCSGGLEVSFEQWGDGTVDEVHGLSVGPAGEAIAVGKTNGPLEGQTPIGMRDHFVSARFPSGKTDSNWTRVWGTAYDDYAEAVVVDSTGNVFVVGEALGVLGAKGFGVEDAVLTKFGPDHVALWSSQWGSTESDFVTGVTRDGMGNLFVSGHTRGDWQQSTRITISTMRSLPSSIPWQGALVVSGRDNGRRLRECRGRRCRRQLIRGWRDPWTAGRRRFWFARHHRRQALTHRFQALAAPDGDYVGG